MKIYIAGHRGMVGSAIWRNLEKSDNNNLIGRTSKELDLKDQKAVNDFIESEKPDVIIDAAARVGGILANNEYPYQFLMENMLIQNNLINASVNNKIKKFIFLGSSCIYPKMAPQPLREEHLLTGPLEPTNEWYAIAKISGVKATESVRKQYGYDYVSLMPTNLYGPYDNFDLKTSHVLPAMIRKFHEAKLNGNKNVSLWGTGSPKREFLHVDDLAKAVRFALENELPENLYNVGYGSDLSIKELAELIQKITDHKGRIDWDPSKPDGTPRKWMDSSKLRNNGWKPSIELEDGIRATYSWFLDNVDQIKEVKINN
ncbi:GDP-L-fucose synthase [Salibacter halophilus]|uniref:GDP-L-fucose synthase n=2 Tax=Salibacter halophilus TaxID=1803916 RepID=A0A6N6M5B7_9FLAO|nr:GDP-L-fucose synthase [Salibacter halophilus]